MKIIIVSMSCLLLAITQTATADDVAVNRSAPQQRPSRPTSGIRTVTTSPRQVVNQPRLNGQRISSPVAQPGRGIPLAMNSQPRQTFRQPQQTPKPAMVTENLRRANANRRSYFDALRRFRHDRHDCKWWKQHCTTIVFAGTGYYYLDASYWYPAFGYDPAYDYYDYDGPIYTYGNLLPDQVIANVQAALQEAGYYLGPITGSLSPATRSAIANYQRDYGLIITGAIDQPTVESLGLN